MSRTISLSRKIELPSLHDVFELKEKLPEVSGDTTYWQVKGLYILDKKARLLCGFTGASTAEITAFSQLHKKLRLYYHDRIFISALNHAQEGVYFHRDEIESEGTNLKDYFANPPEKLSIKDLELIHAVFQEAQKLKDLYGLVHHELVAEDIWIRPQPTGSILEKLGLVENYSILYLNFRRSDLEIDPIERLHDIFTDLIGTAYLDVFR